MKKLLLLCCISLISCYTAVAQTDTTKPNITFESLKLNSAPAFVAISVDPENIQRPASPSQFIAGIQNAIVNNKLKPNVAFEFSPYYLVNKKGADSIRFNPSEYLLSPANGIFNRIAKTTSFSLGTSESDTVVFGKLKPGTALGLGIRFLLAEGQPKKGIIATLKEWNTAYIKYIFYDDINSSILTLDASKDNIPGYVEQVLLLKASYESITLRNKLVNGLSYSFAKQVIEDIANDLVAKAEKGGFTKKEDFVAFIKNARDINKAVETAKLATINQSGKLPFAKQGFLLEFAVGQAILFQNSAWQDMSYAKTAFWLTPSYKWQLQSDKNSIKTLDAMGVIRYTKNNIKDSVDVSDYFDAGLKMQFTTNSWSFSLEGISRYASTLPPNVAKHYTWRWMTAINYKMNDLVTFSFNFGGNFNGNTATYTDPKNMFAVGGVNLGVFK